MLKNNNSKEVKFDQTQNMSDKYGKCNIVLVRASKGVKSADFAQLRKSIIMDENSTDVLIFSKRTFIEKASGHDLKEYTKLGERLGILYSDNLALSFRNLKKYINSKKIQIYPNAFSNNHINVSFSMNIAGDKKVLVSSMLYILQSPVTHLTTVLQSIAQLKK